MAQVIDIECFIDQSSALVVKEVAVKEIYELDVHTKTFQPPFPWRGLPMRIRQTNAWIHHNLNKLRWSDGELPYDQLKPYLQSVLKPNLPTYAKGREKCEFLSNLLDRSVVDLNDLGCPKAEKLPRSFMPCPNARQHPKHTSRVSCAVRKCIAYSVYLECQGLDECDMTELIVGITCEE